MRKKAIILFTAILLLLVGTMSPVYAKQKTVYVKTPEELKAAIDSCAKDIFITKSMKMDGLNIDHTVEIKSKGKTLTFTGIPVSNEEDETYGIYVSGEHIEIDGVNLEFQGTTYGIFVNGAKDFEVDSGTLSGTVKKYVLTAQLAKNLQIENIVLEAGQAWNGVHLVGSTTTISRSKFLGSKYGDFLLENTDEITDPSILKVSGQQKFTDLAIVKNDSKAMNRVIGFKGITYQVEQPKMTLYFTKALR